MIVAVCSKDKVVNDIAQQAARYNRLAFGKCCGVQQAKQQKLDKHENLFLVAHNAEFTEDSDVVIGSHQDQTLMSSVDVLKRVNIFPNDYDGSIFVYVLEGDAGGQATKRFVKQVKSIVSQVFPQVEYYRHVGSAQSHVPAPHERVWLRT